MRNTVLAGHVGIGIGVRVGGAGVVVGDIGVAVAGTGVAVGGTGVAVGGTGVAVGGTGVAVGGTGVAVTMIFVAGFGVLATHRPSNSTIPILHGTDVVLNVGCRVIR